MALDVLFPRTCVSCNKQNGYLCDECLANKTTPLKPPWCDRCGLPAKAGGQCAFCRDHPPAFAGLRTAYAFEGALREAVLSLKYRGLRAAGEELGDLLARFVVDHPLPVDVIVPVPLHPRRLKERGYNQAEVIARPLGEAASLAVTPAALQRTVWTEPQARMGDRTHRARNVNGAFAARAELVAGRRVAVVDDVCTTGATLNACADALTAAGAVSVWGLTLAREL